MYLYCLSRVPSYTSRYSSLEKNSKFNSEFGKAITIPRIISIFVWNLISLHTNRITDVTPVKRTCVNVPSTQFRNLQVVKGQRTVLQHKLLFPHLPLASFASKPSASTTVTWSTTMGGYNIENTKNKNVKTKYI